MSRPIKSPRSRQRGGVTLLLVLVLLVLAALVGVLAVRGATSDLQMAGAERLNRSGFYCAEAGLNAARPFFAANAASWTSMLHNAFAGYPVVGDVDGLAGNDYQVTLEDNHDEAPASVNDPLTDSDGVVLMVSTCISTTMSSSINGRVLKEVITNAAVQGTDYRFQAGHSSSHSGNEN